MTPVLSSLTASGGSCFAVLHHPRQTIGRLEDQETVIGDDKSSDTGGLGGNTVLNYLDAFPHLRQFSVPVAPC